MGHHYPEVLWSRKVSLAKMPPSTLWQETVAGGGGRRREEEGVAVIQGPAIESVYYAKHSPLLAPCQHSSYCYNIQQTQHCLKAAPTTLKETVKETVETDENANILPSPAAQIGRQLAVIGDDINDRYAPQFNRMIGMLNITPDTAYEAFAGVARKLFRDGNINWGRVVTLLCFGYRMAVTVIQRGIRGFFSNIVGFIVKFIFKEKIAQWIAEQGGWRAALLYVPETVGWPTIGLIFSFAALTVLTAYFLSRKH